MSGRSTMRELAAMLSLALLAACQKAPAVGAQTGAVVKLNGPKIELVAATADAPSGKVSITYVLTKDGTPITGADAKALNPAFTLAALGPDPVTQAPATAWRSLLLTGSETLDALPVSPPGTSSAAALPPLPPHGQPGADLGGTIAELGDGKFTYTFAAVTAGSFAQTETLRAGAYLRGTTGSPLTTSTLDFVPSGGAPARRELVLDTQCANCHGVLKAHGGSRYGTKICVTCHTYQHADAETLDPAAILFGAKWTPDHTNPAPNPLELGRFVHRIHRGKTLPTLYKANQSSTGLAPKLDDPAAEPPPLPFSSSRSTQNPSLVGTEFSVIGYSGLERIFGKVFWYADANHVATDPMTANGAPLAAKVVRGVTFPRDYRDCDACHAGAGDAALVQTEISRRTCQGCHPDVWFGQGIPDGDKLAANRTHVAHPGGPQDDDLQCRGCHVPTALKPSVEAPIAEAHVALVKSERYDKPTVTIVSVTNFKAGLTPTVVFKVTDRNGDLAPSLVNPVPAMDANPGGGKPSPVPRAFTGLTFYVAGPASPDVLSFNSSAYPIRETLDFVGKPTATPPVPPTPLNPPDANGQYTYTFTNKLPDGASGTWLLWTEARRTLGSTSAPAKFYDPPAAPGTPGVFGQFYWPYSGDTSLTEVADNAFVWIDADAGATGAGSAQPRRMLTQVDKCNLCHLRLVYHGGRTNPAICIGCHAPDKSDYGNRPKDGNGVVLTTTFDDIEERALHFKLLIHRIHTGSRSGPASLELTPPYTGSGGYVRTTTSSTGVITVSSTPRFRNLGEFPNDQANCTICHYQGSYHPENIPADALPTWGNETAKLLHVGGTAAHPANEPGVLPMAAACNGCHATAFAQFHAAQYTSGGKEQCLTCHGAKGSQSVDRVHGIPVAP